MMCEECGIRPAKFHLMTITDNERTERNLCEVCMAKYQRKIPGLDVSNLAGILSGILEGKKDSQPEVQDTENDSLTCAGCGMTYAQFRKEGKLGCAGCYAAFKKPLESLLLKIHGNTQHAGRMPGGLQNDASIRLRIDRLRQELVKAIAAEEYEQAALLRDQVRALTMQLEEAGKHD